MENKQSVGGYLGKLYQREAWLGRRRSVESFASGKFAYVREALLEQTPDFKGAKKGEASRGKQAKLGGYEEEEEIVV